jgi:hypothetical protein
VRPSLRFLALIVVGWAGIRSAALGYLPGSEMFRIARSEAKPSLPPIVATEFPPIEPAVPFEASYPAAPAMGPAPASYSVAVRPVAVPVYYYAASAAPPARTSLLPPPRRPASFVSDEAPAFYSPLPTLAQWPLAQIAASSLPARRSVVVVPGQSIPARLNKLDRLQLTAWALLRGRTGEALGLSSLASGGQLGGSQAGSRLTYNFTRQIAASLRFTSDVGRRGGEVAAGARIQPVLAIPLWLTAERRHRLGSIGSGRNAFALFAEGGVYQRSMPFRFSLDAYLQAGVVGFKSRDRFVDGALTLTRPVYRNFSGGFGIWGGAQPGVYRVDAGPRVTMNVRNNVKVHVDWRQRLAGNAQPGSGPAITLAGDF